MARVTSGITKSRHHRKIKSLARGFSGYRSNTFVGAQEGVMHALKNAMIGRRLKKRDMRGLWIVRINAALRPLGISYSRFIKNLKDSNASINRKVLSEIAITDPETFSKIVAETSQKNG